MTHSLRLTWISLLYGALLAATWRHESSRNLPRRVATISMACVGLSCVIECAQVFIPVRVTSLTDPILAAAGAENVDFPLKTACCGGAHTLSDSDMSTKLVLNILRAAKMSGADVIATECPTCHSGLEMHQIRAEKNFGEKVDIKILYFTQLLGMALGLKPRKVGVHENISDSMRFLKEKGLA